MLFIIVILLFRIFYSIEILKQFKNGAIDGYYAALKGEVFSDYKEKRSKTRQSSENEKPIKNKTKNSKKTSKVTCHRCGYNLRIKLVSKLTEHICPHCNGKFNARFYRGILSIVFIPDRRDENDEADERKLSLNDAYKLFNVNEDSSLENISHAYKHLIQQYHPDKVTTLGIKLKKLAETECKNINIAYDLIKKSKKYN